MMKKVVLIMLLGIFTTTVNAGITKVHGTVADIWLFNKNLGTYNTGDVGLAVIYINSSKLLPACGNPNGERRIAISSDHPLYSTVVSMVLMAKTTENKIEMRHLDTCTQRSNSWDFALIQFQE